MLVCHVSQLARRTAIAADLAEVAAAADAPGTGNVVFATLVDDPASVRETVDAYLGEIMLEAASADTNVDASIPATYAADVTETVTAAHTQDGTVAALPTTATWDPATVSNVTLSGGNLVATNTGTSSTDQGAHVATVSGKTSGKYYFECNMTQSGGGGGGPNVGMGIGTTASTYTGMGDGGGITGALVYNSGNIWVNGSNTSINIGSFPTGGPSLICVAADLDNRKIWFRKGAAGNWNNNASFNPATNTGGVTIPSGTMVPFGVYGGSGGTSGNIWAANFGASGFSGAVPSGFTAGWPA